MSTTVSNISHPSTAMESKPTRNGIEKAQYISMPKSRKSQRRRALLRGCRMPRMQVGGALGLSVASNSFGRVFEISFCMLVPLCNLLRSWRSAAAPLAATLSAEPSWMLVSSFRQRRIAAF